MLKNLSYVVLTLLLFGQCHQPEQKEHALKSVLMANTLQQAVDTLEHLYGTDQVERIRQGVRLTASLWRNEDGNDQDFISFCGKNFIADTAELDQVFQRISTNFEVIFGYFNTISVDLQRPLQLDMGKILPIDERFGSYNPFTHFTDDFFANKIAFVITLNFPHYTLQQKNELGSHWSRKEWAYARLGDIFDSRIPARASQAVSDALNESDMYIADYNIFAGKLLDSAGHTLFPADMKLLSHWNLRDEIKSDYGQQDGLLKQRLLYTVMKRIVTQEIPKEVINSDQYTWNPVSNTIYQGDKEMKGTPETDRRYAVLLDFFHAQQGIDPYYPDLNTYIKRTFESDMEIPLDSVKTLFSSFLSTPEIRQVATLISKRLGRPLEPFDIWYDGFKTRTSVPAETLDAMTRKKYPNRAAIQADLPRILIKMGFDPKKAAEITSWVQVDPARGSGHASPSETKEQKSLLRTRIFSNGMDYKGYNIAVHEFGHNVEQTISLHDVDYYLLHGVPNTAFTEALAFIFQKKDLQLLGIKDINPDQDALNDLDNFWSLYEIMGVSLVDIGTWEWLYAHPDATAATLRDAVNQIADSVWNQYYAPVFGVKDQPILAIYSHMINAPLYLPNYVYGQIIQFQIEEYLKGKDFAREIERIYRQGRLTPNQWIHNAVDSGLSVQPIIRATDAALKRVGRS